MTFGFVESSTYNAVKSSGFQMKGPTRGFEMPRTCTTVLEAVSDY